MRLWCLEINVFNLTTEAKDDDFISYCSISKCAVANNVTDIREMEKPRAIATKVKPKITYILQLELLDNNTSNFTYLKSIKCLVEGRLFVWEKIVVNREWQFPLRWIGSVLLTLTFHSKILLLIQLIKNKIKLTPQWRRHVQWENHARHGYHNDKNKVAQVVALSQSFQFKVWIVRSCYP